MIRYLERGIQENQLEEDSDLRKMVGDFPNLGLQTLDRGKLIVKNGSNILIPKEAWASILRKLHSTQLGPEMMKNIFWNKINEDVEKTQHEGCHREGISKIKKEVRGQPSKPDTAGPCRVNPHRLCQLQQPGHPAPQR